jgi:Ca2+-binding RTX toxin-like protein
MKAPATRRAALAVETLEERCVPTTATFYSNGVLAIAGTSYNDRILVQQNGYQISVNDGQSIIPINGAYAWVNSAYVSGVVVDAGAGDDIVNLGGTSATGANALRVPATVYGGTGNDLLIGGLGNNTINGGGGQDTMSSVGGNTTYSEPYNASTPVINGTRPEDVRQGPNSGSCVLLATIGSAAAQGMNLASRITYLGGTQYSVQLYNPTTLAPTKVTVNFDGTWHSGPWNRTLSSELANDPMEAVSGEFWTILYQRAYLQMMSNLYPGTQQYANPNNATAAVTGRTSGSLVNSGSGFGTADLQAMAQALSLGHVVVAGTLPNAPAVDGMLAPTHAYTVVSVFTSGGTTYVRLRNPWGIDGLQASRDGADDGYITITWASFRLAFSAITAA